MESKGISIILYPRSYNKRGHYSLHSVQGLTPDGREVNVKLRLEEKHQGKEYAPSIAEFSREDRKATQACIATPENGPDNREGILLFSQAIPDSKSQHPHDTYIAKWASVLAEDSESPDPFFGFARMHIARNSSAIIKLRTKLREAKAAGVDAEEIMAIESRIQDTRNYAYPAIFYYPEQSVEVVDSDRELLFKKIAEFSAQHSRNNLLGGVFLRWLDGEGRVDPKCCEELFPRFISTKNAFETAVMFAKRITQDYGSGLLKKAGGSIDIMPLVRINTGQVSSAHYGQQNRYETVKRLYYDEQGYPLLCRASARVTHYSHNDRTYLSRLYALTEPLGDPRRLSLAGGFSKLFVGEKPKYRVDLATNGAEVEVPAGLSPYKEGTNLSIDFFFSKDRYLDFPKNESLAPKSPPAVTGESSPQDESVPVQESSHDRTPIPEQDMDKMDSAKQETLTVPGSDESEDAAESVNCSDVETTVLQVTEAHLEQNSDETDEQGHVDDAPGSVGEDASNGIQDDEIFDNTASWLTNLDGEDDDLPGMPIETDDEDGFFDDLPVEEAWHVDSEERSGAAIDKDNAPKELETGGPDAINEGPENLPIDEIDKQVTSQNVDDQKDLEKLDDDNEESASSSGGLAAFLNL